METSEHMIQEPQALNLGDTTTMLEAGTLVSG
jgi:hypothetical protein